MSADETRSFEAEPGRTASDRPLAADPPKPPLSVSERVARGRAARREVPRERHATFEARSSRPDPIALLESQAASRVAELVPIRYGRMVVSPFAFFRGSALVMASDLAATPSSGFLVQCCGDAHLSNFGLYASPERRLIFDINDFDETLPGPWEWDLKRLAVSMLIAARSNGFSTKAQEQIVLDTLREYRSRMREFAAMSNTGVWYTHFEIDQLLPELRARVGKEMGRRLDKLVAKAFRRDSAQAFAKLTHEVDGERTFVTRAPLIVRFDELDDVGDRDRAWTAVRQLLSEYARTLPHHSQKLLEQFHLVDLARKVVGVGSVGTAAWIALLLGRDGRDPLVLQIKEAQRSVLEGYLEPSRYANAGERVVAGQRIMQATSDVLLGWLSVTGSVYGGERDYYVRQFRDWKGSAVIEAMDARALNVYGQLCAATLAHAHARSGDRIAIASYLGGGATFDRAVLAFSEAYSEQNERDYTEVAEAARLGRIEAETRY